VARVSTGARRSCWIGAQVIGSARRGLDLVFSVCGRVQVSPHHAPERHFQGTDLGAHSVAQDDQRFRARQDAVAPSQRAAKPASCAWPRTAPNSFQCTREWSCAMPHGQVTSGSASALCGRAVRAQRECRDLGCTLAGRVICTKPCAARRARERCATSTFRHRSLSDPGVTDHVAG
jgi:hypothetical protein